MNGFGAVRKVGFLGSTGGRGGEFWIDWAQVGLTTMCPVSHFWGFLLRDEEMGPGIPDWRPEITWVEDPR